MPDWSGLFPADEIEVYRQGGYHKRIGLGSKPALLITDVEYNFTGDQCEPILDSIAKYSTSCGPMAWEAIPHIARMLSKCRDLGLPIIYTHGVEREDTRRSPRPGAEIVDELAPRPGELVIAKRSASAFFNTYLAPHLIKNRVDTVIHTGCTTSGCVRASVVDGRSYGFMNAVVEECVFDRALTSHRMSLFDIDAKYGDVMTLGEVEDYLDSLA